MPELHPLDVVQRAPLPGAPPTCRCPECGSDLTRFELTLDNGFGFEFLEDGVIVYLAGEPEDDFRSYYFEQLKHMGAWCVPLEEHVSEPEQLMGLTRLALTQLLGALEKAAQEAQAEGFSVEDFIAGALIPRMLTLRLVRDRIGEADDEAVFTEAKRIT